MNAAVNAPAGAESTENRTQVDPPWSRTRWLMLLALVFAAHVGVLFAFGARKSPAPRPVGKVPVLYLARSGDEWIALTDPTLFALPHPRDFSSVIRTLPLIVKQPPAHWAEPSGELAATNADLGTVFADFMQTNRFLGFELQLKPPLAATVPVSPLEPVLPRSSTLTVGRNRR